MHQTQNYNFSIRNGISDLNDCCCEATFTLLMAIYSLSHKFSLRRVSVLPEAEHIYTGCLFELR